MLNIIVVSIAICSGLVNLVYTIVRAAESIYELKKHPELTTMGQVIQTFKNFFTLETYSK
jgi:hypothetical protein